MTRPFLTSVITDNHVTNMQIFFIFAFSTLTKI